MSVFYVYQGETFAEELKKGLVWSPKLNKDGKGNKGFSTMTKIKEGDFIVLV